MKKIMIVSLIVVALFFAVAVIIPLFVSSKIETIVRKEADDMLDARLDFDKIDLSLLRHFPNASIDIKALSLSGNGAFSADTLLAADRISVVVDLMSIFGDGGFVVKKVVCSHPQLYAKRLADGRVNWNILRSETDTSDDNDNNDRPSSFRLSVRDFRVTDAELHYSDDSTNIVLRTAPVAVQLKGDMSSDETDLALRLQADKIFLSSGGMTFVNGIEAELNAVVKADIARGHFSLADNTLRINAVVLSLAGWVEKQTDGVLMDVSINSSKVMFRDILSLVPAFYTKGFSDLQASGRLSMSAWARGRMYGATMPAFEVKLDVADGSFRYVSLPKSVSDIYFNARLSNPGGVFDCTVFDLPELRFAIANNPVTASFRAVTPVSDPSFEASVAGRFDLGDIAAVYPLGDSVVLRGVVAADIKASGRMSDIESRHYDDMMLSGTFTVEKMDVDLPQLPVMTIDRASATLTQSAMTLGECSVTIGDSDVAANGQVSGYVGYLLRGETLSGRLYVRSRLLDLNQMMAGIPSSGGSESDEADSSGVAVIPRNLDLTLYTTMNKILLQKMTINSLSGELSVAGGRLGMDHLGMNIFGGTVYASGSYSTAEDARRPDLRLSLNVTKASFARTFEELDMVQRLVPLFEKIGGDYSMALEMSARMQDDMSLDLNSVNADGEISSENIKLQNIKAFEAMATTLKNDNLRNIEARDMKVKFSVRGGKLTTKPFDIRIGGTLISMSGTTGLDQVIDYVAKVTLPDGSTGGTLQTVNVGIGGTFSDPKISVGVKDAVKDIVTNAIDKQINKLTGSANASEEIDRQTEKLRDEAHKAGEKLVAAAKEQRTKLVDAAKNPLAKIAAEKAGDALVKKAEEQASKLESEAERRIEELKVKLKSRAE